MARRAAKRWESLPTRAARALAGRLVLVAGAAARETERGPTSRVAAGRLMLVAGAPAKETERAAKLREHS